MPVSLSFRSAADASCFFFGEGWDTLSIVWSMREKELGFDANFWDCRNLGGVRLTRSFVMLDG